MVDTLLLADALSVRLGGISCTMIWDMTQLGKIEGGGRNGRGRGRRFRLRLALSRGEDGGGLLNHLVGLLK